MAWRKYSALLATSGLWLMGCEGEVVVREIIRETTIIKEVPAEKTDKNDQTPKTEEKVTRDFSIAKEAEDLDATLEPTETLGEASKHYDVNYVHIDLAGAVALLSMEKDKNIVTVDLNVSLQVIENALGQEVSIPLYKMLSDASAAEAIRNFVKESEDHFSDADQDGLDIIALARLPKISTVAINQCDEVFVVFASPFIFRDKVKIAGKTVDIKDYPDADKPESPFTCQFFKVNQRLGEYSPAHQLKRSNLTCISPSLELSTINPPAGQIQFDGPLCNLYFVAHLAGHSEDLIIKRDATSGELTESTNQNICFNDYRVTQQGGILYTGATKSGNNCGSASDRFLRYILPLGSLREIAKGGEFIYRPIESGTDEGQVVYYGPYPIKSADSPWGYYGGWNNSWHPECLYQYDPYAEDNPGTPDVHEATTKLAACYYDAWSYTSEWYNPGLSNKDLMDRCKQETYFLGNGTSCWHNCSEKPKEVLVADITDDDTDDIVVIGDLRHKPSGYWRCSVCIKKDIKHCIDSEGRLTSLDSDCSNTHSNYYRWTDYNGRYCYWDVRNEDICKLGKYEKPGVEVQYGYCNYDNYYWNNQFLKGVGLVKDDHMTIGLLSDKGHAVQKTWVIFNKAYYSANLGGVYSLHSIGMNEAKAAATRQLLRNIEVYKLVRDPTDSRKLLVSGLNFDTNKFFVGTFNPNADSPQATLTVLPKLKGVVDAVIILP